MVTIDNSVARMSKLLSQLQSGDTAGPRERVNLSDALCDAIQKTENERPVPRFENEARALFANIDRERFTGVVTHMIRNAQEATAADGSVIIRLREVDDEALINIEDDGCGMPEEFIRNRLFRPFDSTKGSRGMGIGAYQAQYFCCSSRVVRLTSNRNRIMERRCR